MWGKGRPIDMGVVSHYYYVMMNGIKALFLLIAFLVCVSGLYGQSKTDFDGVVNFFVNLKEIHESLQTGRSDAIGRGRFLLINGTLTDVTPKKSWFFLLSERQIDNPDQFIAGLRNGKNALARLIQSKLSEEARALLAVKPLDQQGKRAQLKELVKALNDILKKANLSNAQVLFALPERSGLREIVRLGPKGEELAYLNRLLLDYFFADSVRPVTILGEIVSGEWIGTEEVRSYNCLVRFTGSESFKVFHRRRASRASAVMIPENAKVLVVVVPVSPVELEKTTMWLTDVLYVRRID